MLDDIFNECETKMQHSVEHMMRDFKTLRTGKVTTQVLDKMLRLLL